jgi:hypothetical protein
MARPGSGMVRVACAGTLSVTGIEIRGLSTSSRRHDCGCEASCNISRKLLALVICRQ